MTNRRAGRAGIGLKSNTPVAQKAIDLSNPNHYASIIKRVCNRRMPQNEFPDLCAHALGCDPRRGGPATLCLHALGFLDPDLPPHQRSEANVKQNPFAFSNPNRTLINKTYD